MLADIHKIVLWSSAGIAVLVIPALVSLHLQLKAHSKRKPEMEDFDGPADELQTNRQTKNIHGLCESIQGLEKRLSAVFTGRGTRVCMQLSFKDVLFLAWAPIVHKAQGRERERIIRFLALVLPIADKGARRLSTMEAEVLVEKKLSHYTGRNGEATLPENRVAVLMEQARKTPQLLGTKNRYLAFSHLEGRKHLNSREFVRKLRSYAFATIRERHLDLLPRLVCIECHKPVHPEDLHGVLCQRCAHKHPSTTGAQNSGGIKKSKTARTKRKGCTLCGRPMSTAGVCKDCRAELLKKYDRIRQTIKQHPEFSFGEDKRVIDLHDVL